MAHGFPGGDRLSARSQEELPHKIIASFCLEKTLKVIVSNR